MTSFKFYEINLKRIVVV